MVSIKRGKRNNSFDNKSSANITCLFKQYHLCLFIVHAGHGHSYWSTDVSAVAYHETLVVKHNVVAVDLSVEAYGTGQMAGVINKDTLQAE